MLVLLIATKQAQSDNDLMSKATRKDYEISFLGKAINIASNVDINSNSIMLKKRRARALHFFGGNCFKLHESRPNPAKTGIIKTEENGK